MGVDANVVPFFEGAPCCAIRDRRADSVGKHRALLLNILALLARAARGKAGVVVGSARLSLVGECLTLCAPRALRRRKPKAEVT